MDQEIKKEFEQLGERMDKKFGGIEEKFDNKIDQLAVMVKEGFDAVDGQITREIGKAKLDILDAMDDKMANLKGDLIILMRGEDKKLSHLVEILRNKNILTKDEREEILKMQPFPQLV